MRRGSMSMWRPELVRRGAEAREAGMEVMELDELLLLLAVVRLLLDFCFDLGLDLDSDSNWHLLESGSFFASNRGFSAIASIFNSLPPRGLRARRRWSLAPRKGDWEHQQRLGSAMYHGEASYLGKLADTIILVRAFASLGQHAVASKLAEKGRGWNKMMEKIIANVMVEISLMVTIVIDDVA